jgi:uncharacterized protein
MRKVSILATLAISLLALPSTHIVVAQAAEHAPRVIAAGDQPTKEQIQHLFDAMRLKEQMSTMMSSMSTMMQQQISSQVKQMAGDNLPADKQAELDKIMHKYMERAMGLYPVTEMVDDMTAIYQKHLSKEDVDAYIAFYTSPAGQHLLDEQPAIMKEYLPVVSQRMQERSKSLNDDMMKDLEGLAKPSGQ